MSTTLPSDPEVVDADAAAPVAEPATPTERRASRVRRSCQWVDTRPLRSWSMFVGAVYLVLIAFGLTFSSINVSSLRADPEVRPDGMVAGESRSIRSDEFLRSSPWTIGTLHSDDDDFFSPLTYPDASIVSPGSGGVLTKLMYPEAAVVQVVAKVAPKQAFAATWWFVSIGALLMLPLWLRQLGVTPAIAIPASLLVVFSPVNAWWTYATGTVVLWAVLAGWAALAASARWHVPGGRRWSVAISLLGGLAFARLALSYQPWAIPMALVVLVPTLCVLLAIRGQRRSGIATTAGIVLVGGALLGAYLHEHSGSIGVLSDTVYPGSRRFIGSMSNLAQLFGAPHMWLLEKAQPPIVNTNQSEAASGYLVLAVVAGALLPAVAWARTGLLRVASWSSVGVFLAVATWCSMAWPGGAVHIPLMNLVSPGRLVQILGMAGAITFAIVLAAWNRSQPERRLPAVLTTAAVTFFITAMAGSTFREQFAPTYRIPWIALVSLLAAAVVAIAVAAAGRRWALLPMVLAAVPIVAFVHPVQLGFADLRDSDAAVAVRAAHRAAPEGSVWVNDDIYTDALLMANAQTSLSGQEWAGPEKSAWRLLDPDDESIDAWNRGAAYIVFQWAGEGDDTKITSPGADMVMVTVDPCNAALGKLGVGLVMSVRELDGDCLTERAHIAFGGSEHWIYDRA